MRSLKSKHSGVTLIELIIVMVIMSIISATALIFVQRMFSGYAQTRDRLSLAAQARLTMSRVKRELKLALPNSVRVSSTGGVTYLEFVPVIVAGRYRAASATGTDTSVVCPADSASLSDNGVLTIGSADTCFKSLGPMDITGVSAGNWLVVFNAGPGYSDADFYESGSSTGGNKAALTSIAASAAETRLAFQSNIFKWDSPGHRFFIVSGPITYACNPATKTLTRYSGYAVQASQPTSGIASLAGSTSGDVAKNVSGCQIAYAAASIANQFGLVTVTLNLATSTGDSLNVVAQSQVENMP